MDQTIINWAFGAMMALLGWFLRVVWESLKDLRLQDQILADKVGRIEVLVAGEYVKREEFNGTMTRIFEKLDSIESKLSAKADR